MDDEQQLYSTSKNLSEILKLQRSLIEKVLENDPDMARSWRINSQKSNRPPLPTVSFSSRSRRMPPRRVSLTFSPHHCSLEITKLLKMLEKSIHDQPIYVKRSKIERVVPEGENFSSSIFRLRLKLLLEDKQEKNVSFIIKQVLTNDEGNESLAQKMSKVFHLEIKVYTAVLKGMDSLMSEFHDRRGSLWCRYLGNTSTHIVLEDLAESGFATFQRTEKMGKNAACQVLNSLGRFHAMSKILMKRDVIKMDDFSHNTLTDTDFGKKIYAGPLALLSRVIAESWGREWRNISRRLSRQVLDVGRKMSLLADTCDNRFAVLNHGDLWNCNILLRSTGSGSSLREEYRFIDFQLPFINSFIWDIMLFLGSCVESATRRNHIEELLEAYQGSLKENLIFFGWKGYIPTLYDVKREAERVSYASFVFNTCYFPILTAPYVTPMRLDKLLDCPPEEVFDKRAFENENIASDLKKELKLFAEKRIF